MKRSLTRNDNAPVNADPYYLALDHSHAAARASASAGSPTANDLAAAALDYADMGDHRGAAETHRQAADEHDQEISRLMSASTYGGAAEGPTQAHTDAAHAHRQAATRHEEAAAKDRGSRNREQPTMTENAFGPMPEIPTLNWSDLTRAGIGSSPAYSGLPPGRFGVGDLDPDDDDLDDIDDDDEPVPVPQPDAFAQPQNLTHPLNLAEVVLNHYDQGRPVAQPRRHPADAGMGPMPDIPPVLDIVLNDRREALANAGAALAARQQQRAARPVVPDADVEGMGPMPDPPQLDWAAIAAQHRRRDAARRS
jgi:hypothetical protein